jgi:hypothetical protein
MKGCTAALESHGEGRVWMAPALQAFSGDICGLFSQNSRVSGLFMFRHCLHWP